MGIRLEKFDRDASDHSAAATELATLRHDFLSDEDRAFLGGLCVQQYPVDGGLPPSPSSQIVIETQSGRGFPSSARWQLARFQRTFAAGVPSGLF